MGAGMVLGSIITLPIIAQDALGFLFSAAASPLLCFAEGSENQLQRELQLARVLRARNASEVRRKCGPVRNIEVRVIEQVISLRPELQFAGFLQGDFLLQGEIE